MDVKEFTDVEIENEMELWIPFNIHPLLLRGLHSCGFKSPTPIQNNSIQVAIRDRKDIIGAAETGSGKTLAFGLPVLNSILNDKEVKEKYLRCLIVTPTRELAMQICDHLRQVSKFTKIRVVPVVGGLSHQKQERLLSYSPEIIVGTPGRLWEFMSQSNSYLSDISKLNFFIIDEADRMIEFGHFKELENITSTLIPTEVEDEDEIPVQENVSVNRQTFIFSATLTISQEARKNIKKRLLHKK